MQTAENEVGHIIERMIELMRKGDSEDFINLLSSLKSDYALDPKIAKTNAPGVLTGGMCSINEYVICKNRQMLYKEMIEWNQLLMALRKILLD